MDRLVKAFYSFGLPSQRPTGYIKLMNVIGSGDKKDGSPGEAEVNPKANTLQAAHTNLRSVRSHVGGQSESKPGHGASFLPD